MDELTLVYTFYNQHERIPGIIKEKHSASRVVIVDDHSERPLNQLNNIEVYRVDDDIKWNQPGARNLGFKVSDGWIVCADIDHLVTRKNVYDLIAMKKEKGTVYYLGREDNDSWNVYLIHKDDFEKIGGYDEDFCGHYGYDDIEFLWRCKKNLNVNEIRDIKVKVFAKESSSKLERDYEFNRKLLELKRHQDINKGKRINFEWHRV